MKRMLVLSLIVGLVLAQGVAAQKREPSLPIYPMPKVTAADVIERCASRPSSSARAWCDGYLRGMRDMAMFVKARLMAKHNTLAKCSVRTLSIKQIRVRVLKRAARMGRSQGGPSEAFHAVWPVLSEQVDCEFQHIYR